MISPMKVELSKVETNRESMSDAINEKVAMKEIAVKIRVLESKLVFFLKSQKILDFMEDLNLRVASQKY